MIRGKGKSADISMKYCRYTTFLVETKYLGLVLHTYQFIHEIDHFLGFYVGWANLPTSARNRGTKKPAWNRVNGLKVSYELLDFVLIFVYYTKGFLNFGKKPSSFRNFRPWRV